MEFEISKFGAVIMKE